MTATIITARTPDQGLEDALHLLKVSGVLNNSRNGAVLRAPGPVITQYSTPRQRVSLSPLRDANPFFHLYEALWMLAGRCDVTSVSRYAARMATFSDDGEVMHGAYGWRWREFFGFDQLREIVTQLRENPLSRRAVLTMWAPNGDLIAAEGGAGGPSSKDLPCNTHVYFDATNGPLDMTVCNRSNDVVWGCYGANVVHMSMLQEFVACAVGLPIGTYYQMSNNFHLYVEREDCQRLLHTHDLKVPAGWVVRFGATYDYEEGSVKPGPLFFEDPDAADDWVGHCAAVVDAPTLDHASRPLFFRSVAVPLFQAHAAYKDGDYKEAQVAVARCVASDWRAAAQNWLLRRQRAAGYATDAQETNDVR